MVKVKICGITNLADACLAVEAGADLLGFIFYEPSPRYVTPEVAGEIVSGINQRFPGAGSHQAERGEGDTVGSLRPTVEPARRPTAPQFIGVFVNAALDIVERTLDRARLDAAQLHGDEPPEFVEYFKNRAFKALRPSSSRAAERLVEKYTRPSAGVPSRSQVGYLPDLLIDAYHPTLFGGTGRVTDWSMAAAVAQQHATLLAGSLTPANVVEAIRVVRPWGVDVSSGVELEKGKKDHDKVREFISAAKGYNDHLATDN